MPKISFSIALPIILAGLFVLVMVAALNYQAPGAVLYLVFFLLAVCVFLFGAAIGQRFSLSVKKILIHAQDLTKGNVKTRVYLEGKNELGELAKAFNAIAQELETTKAEAQMLERSVDMKVKIKTQPLQETITALEQKVKNRTLELEKAIKDLGVLRAQLGAKEAELQSVKSQLNVAAAKKRKKIAVSEPTQEI